MLIKTLIATACTAVVAVATAALLLPLALDYKAAFSSQQYRKAVITEAFESYEKARPQRRARQRGQQMVVKLPEANPTERR